jgi:selenium-dependent xanthine dehydrogenase
MQGEDEDMSTVTITVNGLDYDVAADAMLIRVLRDEIGALSVKEGCDDGTCGTCMVIANGRLVKACNRPASSFAGQQIITTEGLSEREQEVYVHAFGESGGVQCGFCIPGMVLAGKVLLDANPEPTRAAVVTAIRKDICRCTGYRQIVDGILLAGRMLHENTVVQPSSERLRVSDRAHRPDVADKVLGTGKFADDVRLPGMVFAKALRSPTPRGLVKSIDASKALAHPHCLAVLTADDVPANKHGHITPDWDVMIPVGQYTRYTGDALALVASDVEDKLDEIIALIDVDYEEAEPVTSPQQALSPLAPLVHEGGNVYDVQHVKRGNPAQAFRESAHVVTHKFSTPWQEHAFMEPECAVAEPVGEDKLRLYTSSQSVYDEQREIARMLKVAPEQIRSTATLVGGGFGGKEDMSVQHHAALMAWTLKKPVKVKFSRTESLNYHTKRHPMDLEFTVGCDERGKLTGVKVVILADTGAYASIGGPVLQRACTHAGGPYVVPNFEVLGLSLYTNNVPSGAFRGFGVPQSQFGMETCLNELADKVGLNDWEIRYLNAVRPGDPLPNGQLADESTGITDILEDIKGDYHANPDAGLALAYKNTGIGMGLADIGRCILSVDCGKVHLRTSASCMGQGVAQVVMHVLSETVDLRPDQIVYESPDTERSPNSGTSTASRQTLFTGEATRLAAVQLRSALDAVQGDLSKLEGQEWQGEFSPQTDPLDSPKPHPVSHVGYGFGAQLITLDAKGFVEKVLAVYDVGTIINEQSAVGQVEGGVMMGLGYALTEEFVIENGVPQTRYGRLGLIRADKMPQVEVRFVTGPGSLPYAYGAKGMGEISLIPTAPAVARAYAKRDGKRRYSLPLRGTAYKPEPNPS